MFSLQKNRRGLPPLGHPYTDKSDQMPNPTDFVSLGCQARLITVPLSRPQTGKLVPLSDIGTLEIRN